jgi:hypothetical protein
MQIEAISAHCLFVERQYSLLKLVIRSVAGSFEAVHKQTWYFNEPHAGVSLLTFQR